MNDLKTCFRCKQEKVLSEFYRSPRTPDGVRCYCKSCDKKESAHYRLISVERYRERRRRRINPPHVLAKNAEYSRGVKDKFPLKYKARYKLKNAVRKGEITKPNKCSNCKKESKRIEGHHDDYTKFLEVIWLCPICHNQLHRNLKKEKDND